MQPIAIASIDLRSCCFSSKVWKELDQGSKLQLHILNDKNDDEQSSADVDDCVQTDPVKTNDSVQLNKTKVSNGVDNDHNYLSLSDTDTVDCYMVPSPVYPSSPSTPIYPFSTLPLPGPSSLKRMSRGNSTGRQIFSLYCSGSDKER